MPVVLAIDPGPVQSAWLVMGNTAPRAFATWPNEKLLDALRAGEFTRDLDAAVAEKVESFGMPVGAEVFETVFWTGRFAEAVSQVTGDLELQRLGRLKVKLALCHDSRAKDANIRAALIDRFTTPEQPAIGLKRSPGPLFGISGDVWSALAVAVAWSELQP